MMPIWYYMYIVHVSDKISFLASLSKGMINYLTNTLIKINFLSCVLCHIPEQSKYDLSFWPWP